MIDYGDWLLDGNPLGVPTERESQNKALKLPIYRCLYIRNDLEYEVTIEDKLDPLLHALKVLTMISKAIMTKCEGMRVKTDKLIQLEAEDKSQHRQQMKVIDENFTRMIAMFDILVVEIGKNKSSLVLDNERLATNEDLLRNFQNHLERIHHLAEEANSKMDSYCQSLIPIIKANDFGSLYENNSSIQSTYKHFKTDCQQIQSFSTDFSAAFQTFTKALQQVYPGITPQ